MIWICFFTHHNIFQLSYPCVYICCSTTGEYSRRFEGTKKWVFCFFLYLFFEQIIIWNCPKCLSSLWLASLCYTLIFILVLKTPKSFCIWSIAVTCMLCRSSSLYVGWDRCLELFCIMTLAAVAVAAWHIWLAAPLYFFHIILSFKASFICCSECILTKLSKLDKKYHSMKLILQLFTVKCFCVVNDCCIRAFVDNKRHVCVQYSICGISKCHFRLFLFWFSKRVSF